MLKQEKTVTIKEAMKILEVSRTTLYNWIQDGKIKAFRKINNQVRISNDSLQEFIKERMGQNE